MRKCPRATKILAALDRDREAASKVAGAPLIWDAAELAYRDMIVDVAGRQADLAKDYAAAETSKERVRISAETRQLEIVLVRLVKQFTIANSKVKAPAPPPSITSIKASHASRARWDKVRDAN